MKKAFVAFLTALTVIFTVCFGAAGCAVQPAKEIIIRVPRLSTINSITHPEIDSAKTLLTEASAEFVSQYDRRIKITVIEFESDQEQRAVSNTFGTDEATDILYDGFINMSSFIHTGNAVPLDDVLPKDITDDLGSAYVNGGKYDGKMYMLPYMAVQNILIYNKELFRGCGLESYIGQDVHSISTDWTTDDWTYILDTLAANLPVGSVPAMMYAKDNHGDTHIMTLLRAYGSDIFDENDKFNLVNDPKAVAAIKWLQDGVNRGWYLSVPYYKTMSDNNSKFKMGELAFDNFNLSSPLYQIASAGDGLDKYGFVNYPGNVCTFFCDGFEIFDNGDGEKVSIAKDFLRYFYTSEKWMECSAGGIPVSNKVLEKYRDGIFLLKAFSDNAVNSVDFMHNLPNWQGRSNSVRSVFYTEIANLMLKGADGKFLYTPEQCAQRLQDKLNAAIAG